MVWGGKRRQKKMSNKRGMNSKNNSFREEEKIKDQCTLLEYLDYNIKTYDIKPHDIIIDALSNPVETRGKIEEFLRKNDGNNVELYINKKPLLGIFIGSKNTSVYRAHAYPTKIPPDIIEKFIQHFTEIGDIVLDPFAGSGMTGVAALRLKRKAILVDISPAAIHIAYGFTTPVNLEILKNTFKEIIDKVEKETAWMYTTLCEICGNIAPVNYYVWSDVFRCPYCRKIFTYFEARVDLKKKKIKEFRCPNCKHILSKKGLKLIGRELVLLTFRCPNCNSRVRPPIDYDKKLLAKINKLVIPYWYPRVTLDPNSELYRRSGLHIRGVKELADFYTRRNLIVLAKLWNEIQKISDEHIRKKLEFVFTSIVNRASIRYVWSPQRPLNVYETHFFVPSLSVEMNVIKLFQRKFRDIIDYYSTYTKFYSDSVRIVFGTATDLSFIPDNSVDFIFTDPPFPWDAYFGEVNLFIEGWLNKFADYKREIVIHKTKKGVNRRSLKDYEESMYKAFKEMYRVLKAGRWIVTVFQSEDPEAWESLLRSAITAGFEFKGAALMVKSQLSPKRLKALQNGEKIAVADLLLQFNKPLSKLLKSQTLIPIRDDTFLHEIIKKSIDELKMLEKDIVYLRRVKIQYIFCKVIEELLNRGYNPRNISVGKIEKIIKKLNMNI